MGGEGDTPKVREKGIMGTLGLESWREHPRSGSHIALWITTKGQGPGKIENLYPALGTDG